MPLGTLDRDPPPFFRQGPSALSKLAVCSALALLLMVADARFKVMQPVRAGLALPPSPARIAPIWERVLAGRSWRLVIGAGGGAASGGRPDRAAARAVAPSAPCAAR